MDKFKYQILALVIALIIGAGVSYIFTSSSKNTEITKLTKKHEQELLEQNKLKEQEILKRQKKIIRLDSMRLQDSTKLLVLQHKIEQDGVRVELEKQTALKLNTDEKRKWIIDNFPTTN